MFCQARDLDAVAQYIYASNYAKTISGIYQSHHCKCDFLYYLLFPPNFPMHPTGKDLGPECARNLHKCTSNRHSFRLIECHNRLCHAIVANNQDLAAPDFQEQEGVYFSHFRNRLFVSSNSIDPKLILTPGFQRMLCECHASRYQCTVELDQGCNL